MLWRRLWLVLAWSTLLCACFEATSPRDPMLEGDNPLRPVPQAPVGIPIDLQSLLQAPTAPLVRLGRWLFFDARLSADGTVSCATCHRPEYGFSQPTPVATGIHGRRGRRKVPPILNLAAPQFTNLGPQTRFFWDGRASSLERQAMQPVLNPDEMGNTEAGLMNTLSGIAGYRRYFSEAFGDAQVTSGRVTQALAAYERTRLSGNSPFDRWRQGDQAAVSAAVKRGYDLFVGKAECAHCHTPPLFSGSFHNTGVAWDSHTQQFTDEGSYPVTKGLIDEEWPGTFKTPTLREVSRRAPYMHDGSIATLRDVVEYYNRGARPNLYLSAFITPLHLSSHEVDELVAFLESLDGEGWQDRGPTRFPR